MICTGTYELTQADIDSNATVEPNDVDPGLLDNTATASSNQTPDATASEQVPVTQNPVLQIVKTATSVTSPDASVLVAADGDVLVVDEAGDVIAYSMLVTNTGNQTLTGVTVVDPLLGTLDCGGFDGELSPGEDVTCTGSYTVQQSDIDNNGIDSAGNPDDDGDVDNTATADSNESAPDDDSAVVPLAQAPDIAIEKVASAVVNSDGSDGGGVVDEAGDRIDYTITVTNTGNQSLTNVVVNDPLLGGVLTGPDSGDTDADDELDVDEVWVYTASYTVTQADIDAGGNLDIDGEPGNDVFQNEACVDSDQTDGLDCDTEDVPVDENPALQIVKTATSVTSPDGSALVAADGDVLVVDEADDVIAYSLVVTNTGNQTLTNVQVVDSLLGTLECDPALGSSLLPGGMMTCTGSYTVTQDDIDDNGDGDGDIDNLATATSNESAPDDDTEEVPLTQAPDVAIEKVASAVVNSDGSDGGGVVDEAGDRIDYTITVTNTGNQSLTNVVVNDPLLGGVLTGPDSGDTDTDNELDLDEVWIYTGSYTVTQADIDAGGNLDIDPEGEGNDVIHNEACVTTFEEAEDCDDEDVPVEEDPELTIVKTAVSVTNPDTTTSETLQVDEAGDVINYSMLVTNTGNQTLTNVQVSDPLLGTLDCEPALGATLLPGDTMTCTGSYTVLQSDIDDNGDGDGDIDNLATATSNESAPDDDTAEVPLVQAPSAAVIKTTDVESYSAVGDVIDYTIEVINNGNKSLSIAEIEASLSDDLNGVDVTPDLDGPFTDSAGTTPVGDGDTLAPGDSWYYTYSYTIVAGDLDAQDSVTNVVCVNVDGGDEECSEVETPSAGLDIVKTVVSIGGETDGLADTAGEFIEYQVVVTNTGAIDLTPSVSDVLTHAGVDDPQDLGTPTESVEPADGVLSPAETWTYTFSYELTQGDIDDGRDIVNEACALNVDPAVAEVCDDVTTPIDQNPILQIEKTVESIDSTDGVEGMTVVDAKGDKINYEILVTNGGNVTLTNIVVTDDLVADLTCPETTLAPGDSMTCTASYTVTQSDIDNDGIDATGAIDGDGDIDNTAVADSDETGPVDDSADVEVVRAPAMEIVKTAVNADGTPRIDPVDEAGDEIEYSITVTNIGNTTLTGVSVSDPLLPGADLTCPPTDILNPGDSLTCAGTYTVTQEDLDSNGTLEPDNELAGQIDNTATATSNETGPEMASEDVPLVQAPAASVVKSTDVESYSAVGDVIDYSIALTNDGNVSLSAADIAASLSDELNGVDVTGDVAGPFTDVDGTTPVGAGETLAPGGTWYYKYSYTIVEADLGDQATVTNVVCVDADGDGEPSCSPVETPSAGLAIDKVVLSIDGDENGQADSAGDIILYEVVVTNTGAIDLMPSVSDVLTQSGLSEPQAIGNPVESQGPDGLLEPTETWTYTFTYELSQADIDDGGDLVNEACASSDDPAVAEVCDDVTTEVVQNPAVDITKTASSITSTDGEPGETSVDAAGDKINYTITVKNIGNVTLTGIVVSDPLLDEPVDCPLNTLAPGESMTCTGIYTVTQDDIDNGGNIDLDVPANDDNDAFRNEACVATEQGAEDCDTEDVPVDEEPAMTILKEFVSITSTDGEPDETSVDAAGDVINYRITVTNTGNQTLNNVTVDDPLIGDLTCDPADNPLTLLPGDDVVCTGSYTVTQDDIDDDGGGDGDIDNIATGDSDETDPVDDTEDVPVDYEPAISLDKLVSRIDSTDGEQFTTTVDAAGDVIVYEFVVANIGNTTLTNVTVTDPLLDDPVDCPTTTLLVNQSMSCFGEYTVTQDDIDTQGGGDGDIDNTAVADSEETEPVDDSEEVPVDYEPALEIVKTASSITSTDGAVGETSVDAAGDQINYTITVENTGNVTLTNVVVDDPLIDDAGPLSGPASGDDDGDGDLDVGETWVYEASYTVTQDDLDAGGNIDLDGDGNNDAINNEACVDTDQTPEACDEDDVTVDQEPAHELEKTFAEDEVGVGETSSFTLEYTNTGNVTLTDIEITDDVQPLLQVQEPYTTGGDAAVDCPDPDSNPQTVTCEVAELAPGESVTITVDFLALPLANEIVGDNGETSGANYVFYFENGYVLYGSTQSGDATLVDPAGNETDADVEGRNQDIYFNVPFGGDGFQLHLSCSEVFIDGFGDTGPTAADDPEWRILAYEVLRFNTNGLFKDCGQVFAPFEVENSATATATPPAGTTLDPATASDTVTIINIAPIEVTRERVRRGDVEIQYFNTSQADISLDIIRVEWSDGDVLESASYQDGVDLNLSGGSPAQADISTILDARSKDWLKLSFASGGLPDDLSITIVTETNATFTYVYGS